MPDLDERFLALSRVRPPDLWPKIETRDLRPGRGMPARSRLAAAAVAFALSAAGITLAVRAFQGGEKPLTPVTTVSNGMLAFASGGDIYVVNPDGSGLTNLTDTARADDSPDGCAYEVPWEWSPDGTRIALYCGVDAPHGGGANYDVFVMNADGTGRLNLTTSPEDIASGNSQLNPHWSPDGTRIAFDADDGLYVVNADGSGLAKVADGMFPTWSPDGTRIAFVGGREGGGSDIFAVDRDGTGGTRLTDDPAFDERPAWSPDGTRIAFLSDRGGEDELYMIDPDGTGLTRLTDIRTKQMGGYSPTWSPDGTKIAIEVLRDGNWDIYVVNAEGTGSTDITNGPGDENRPSWSPDGMKVAFMGSDIPSSQGENTGTFDVYVVDPEGTNLTRITRGPGAAPGALTWQPIPGGEGPTPTEAPSASPSELNLHVAATIPVTDLDVGVVGDIAIGEQGGVWATVVGQQDPFSTSFVVRLDPQTNEVTASIHIEGDPAGIAAAPDAVWVTVNDTRDAVLRIDPAANAVVATVPLGEDHFAGPVAADASAVWVVDGLFEGEQPVLSLVRIDPVTNEVLARIPLPESSDFDDIAVGEGAVWLTQVNGGNVIKVDPATNQAVATIPAGVVSNRFDGLVAGEGSVWVDALRPDVAQKDWPQETALAIRIDPTSGQIQGDPISLEGGLPSPLRAYSAPIGVGEGGVWLFGYDVNLDHMMVARLNLDTLKVDTSIVIEEQGVSESAAFDGENRAIWIAYHESIVRVDLY